jgi:acyl-CoA thioesterase FadM
MFDIPFADFVGRLHISHERAKFSQADPYGHMSSGHYVNLAFDHRIEAVKDQIQFDVLHLLKAHKLAFFLRDIRLVFVSPSAIGDNLEIASWVRTFSERDLEIRVLVSGKDDRLARALITIQFIFVNVQTGKPVPVPESLPSHADRNLIVELPPVAPYLETLKNLPRDWKEAATATPRTDG